MEVKIFIEEEKGKLITEPAEWCKQVEELGLKGQVEAFANPSAKEGDTGICPFPRLTKEAANVYRHYLPDHEKIEDYKGDPIPLKALAMYALAVKEKYFDRKECKIEIWHAFGKPDPIMVAVDGTGVWRDSDKAVYIMAQWGPEIVSLETMRKQVLEDICAAAKSAVKTTMAKAKSLLESDDDVFMKQAIKKIQEGAVEVLESTCL